MPVYLLQFGHHGSGDAELCATSGMTMHNDRLYVAEFSNGRVSVFQLDGQFCSIFYWVGELKISL